jgi:hypothetical protein
MPAAMGEPPQLAFESALALGDVWALDQLWKELGVTFHHIESNPFSAFRSHPVFGKYEPVRFRHLQAS